MTSETPGCLSRRELLETVGKAAAATVVATPLVSGLAEGWSLTAQGLPLIAVAGVDRAVMLRGKTYLRAWGGYGHPPASGRPARGVPLPVDPGLPPPAMSWRKASGPGEVAFADPKAAVTTATFSTPGHYVLEVSATDGADTATSNLSVTVELPPPAAPLTPVPTTGHTITSPLWAARTKALIVSWIPHCVDQINRTDIPKGKGDGGIDNFIEAAKALRGEPHEAHKGYVFSNAWVHQTVESMSLALMVDPRGDADIVAAQAGMRATLEDWIPKILAAQEPDGYLQTAFTLRDMAQTAGPPAAGARTPWVSRWSPDHRGNHEGYTAGYFLESAINHYTMSGYKDARLYNAAKKLANCWADHIGPPPKQEWFDGHQEMEQALVRFGRFVNERESGRPGDRYIALAKFLLDCRKGGSEYDQSHLPVVQQYEAVGHAVRAMYTYSGMTDVAMETRDVDYQSAVKSLWDNVVEHKYYLSGGVGSGETSEGFGPNDSLRNNSYCETCSSCGEIFFQWKMHLLYHDAKFADLYEQTIYNALFGGLDLEGKNYYYDNPLDANVARYPWHTCPCCVGNLSRTMLMLPTWTYSKDADGLYVNLFVGSAMAIEGIAGTTVEMVQTTNYPWDGAVSIAVNPARATKFTVRVRVPNRDVSSLYTNEPAVTGLTSLRVNGTPVTPVIADGYVAITRTWKKGDTIELDVPLRVQRVHAAERVAADRQRVALRYGALLYNIEAIDQPITGAVAPTSPLATEWRADLLGGVLVIKGRFADGTPFMAIPNFARYNRGAPPAPEPAPVTPPPSTPGAPRPRPPRPPTTSLMWMAEA